MKICKIKYLIVLFVIGLPVHLFAKYYKGAELRTKEAYTYGRFEVRYKASAGAGQTSTFFTYNTDPMDLWNEIDIEIIGRYNNDIQFNTIVPRNGVNHVRHQFVEFNPYLDFHTYTIEWTPDYVSWFIDGLEVYKQTGEHIASLIKPQKIMMNIWNPDALNWVGPWEDRALPKFAYYEYVSYAAYTPGTGNLGSDNNFTMSWIDNFDEMDDTRWDKATHTFNGNNCDFIPENIVFQDGLMILCLTDMDNIGYVDNVPPYILWARAGDSTVTVKFTEKLDKTSAELPSNYAIPGATVHSATLMEDLHSVQLSVPNIDLSLNYSLIIAGIYDVSENRNRQSAQMVNVIMPEPLNFPVKINIGGGAVDDFLADQSWNENVEYGYEDGSVSTVSASQAISGTDSPEIYRSERYGLVTYQVRVPQGNYGVKLMMAENYFDSAQERVFDIYVEGKLISSNVDIHATVGKFSAYQIEIPLVKVEDGILEVHLSALVDSPLLNGFVIEKIETSIQESRNNLPDDFILLSNYPNPFNSSTTICYDLPFSGNIKLQIYDIQGRIVSSTEAWKTAGQHKVDLNMNGKSSGLYFCKLQSNGIAKTIRMVLLK